MAFAAARRAPLHASAGHRGLLVALAFISVARAFLHGGTDASGHVTRGCGPECPERDSCTVEQLKKIGCAPCRRSARSSTAPRRSGTATAISLGVCGALAVVLTGSIMFMGWYTKPKGSTILSGGH